MAIGLIFGREREKLNDWQAYIDSLHPPRKFCHQFENELGSTMSEDIVADKFGRRFDLADPADAVQWVACGAHEKCGQVISKGVCLAATTIMTYQDRRQKLESSIAPSSVP